MANPHPQNTRAEWESLYHQLASNAPSMQRDFPSVPPKITPLITNPACPEHCTRHFVDRILTCPACGAAPYHIMSHQWPWSEGHYWHTVEPIDGAPAYHKACPACKGAL
jgi:hypothetical protein